MINVRSLTLSFGQRIIFDEISFLLDMTQKVGFVGRNGSGKSTLFNVLVGKQSVDSGVVDIADKITIAYLPQEMVFSSKKTIFEETFQAIPFCYKIYRELFDLEQKLTEDSLPEHLEHYAALQSQFIDREVSQAIVEVKKMLLGLGFSEQMWQVPVDQLSLGWKMRIVLAQLLLQKADFYLFDEPTNHLDLFSKEWFFQFLQKASFGFLLVTHDRYFLDHVCTHILELEQGKITIFRGNYTSYLKEKEKRELLLEQKALQQQKEIVQKTRIVARFKAKATKAKMAQSILKKLEKIDRIETPKKQQQISLALGSVLRSGRIVMEAQNISVALGNKDIISHISFMIERGEKVAIVAPNGTGKTTLFKAITGTIQLKSGYVELGYNVRLALFEQDQDSVLAKSNTILQEVELVCTTPEQRTKVRSLLGAFLFSGDDVYKKVAVLSGGEKNRVAMVKVLLQGANFLLLDEPTNHLDLASKAVFLKALQLFKGTILLVCHDRDFLQHVATRILELTPTGIQSFPGNYESYLYHKQLLQRQSDEQLASFLEKETKSRRQNQDDYLVRKQARSLEAKIDKLEKRLLLAQEKCATLEYGTKEFQVTCQEMETLQQRLDEALRQWERLQKVIH